jgi:hypothetical protein
MKFKRLLITCLLIIGSCDDPSLDQPAPPVDQVEPIENTILLSEIIISDPVSEQIITDVNLTYDHENLVSDIEFTGAMTTNYAFEYGRNNQLTNFTKTENGVSINYEAAYLEDTVEITHEVATATQTKTFFIDSQNRIFRCLETLGATTLKDLRYEYTANFNVERFNNLNSSNAITEYSLLSYVFNNNPFTDMNDIIKFIVFEEFIPYTRYLPTTQEMYTVAPRGDVLENSFSYTYILRTDNFPISRTVSKENASGVVENTVETFIYLEN